MKISVLSDVHCEFHDDQGAAFIDHMPTDGDVLVLAGDITTADKIYVALERFAKRWRGKPIVYTPGNHEHWRVERQNLAATLRKASLRLGIHVLQRGVVTIDGVRFIGDTLWFPLSDTSWQMANNWSDFILARGALRTKWPFEANRQARSFLRDMVGPGDVVVTHHLPSARSVDPRYTGAATNCFYVNDLDDLIREQRPAAWIHGHTHSSNDYMIGSTRIVSNPYGYRTEERTMLNRGFICPKIVEVDSSAP